MNVFGKKFTTIKQVTNSISDSRQNVFVIFCIQCPYGTVNPEKVQTSQLTGKTLCLQNKLADAPQFHILFCLMRLILQ